MVDDRVLEQGGMGAKYPPQVSGKIVTASLGYEVDVLKKNKKRTIVAGFNWFWVDPEGKLRKRNSRGWP